MPFFDLPLDQLRAFVGADGLQLSDRIWRIDTAW